MNELSKKTTLPIHGISNCFDFEMNSLSDISKNAPTFKRHNHNVTPNWLIELKTNFSCKSKYGFTLAYKSGYFFWIKRLTLLNGV